jgi:hypothetical protein
LNVDKAPDYKDVPIIQSVRRSASILHKESDLSRARTKEDLSAINNWLNWEDVIAAVGLQEQTFQMAQIIIDKAEAMSDLLLLSLYTHIPPSRALEIRTLR